jgi:hypothetical protein
MQPPDAAPAEGVGAVLRQARERRGMSIDQVSEATRIRATLIRQIEADDFSSCGGAVYARGHMRSIARVLELDSTPLIEEFDRIHNLTKPVSPTPAPEYDPLLHGDRRHRRGFAWAPAMIGSLVVVCLLAVVALVMPDPGGSGGAPSGAAPTAPPMPQTSSAAAPPPTTPPPTNLTLQVQARDADSWLDVRITGTDEVIFQDLLARGEEKTVVEDRALQVRMGSAGALDLSCNGRDLGAQGRLGEVVTVQVALDPAGSGTCQVSGAGSDSGVAAALGLGAAPTHAARDE